MQDLYLLSRGRVLVASAASHYGVSAWLWALARGDAAAPAVWCECAARTRPPPPLLTSACAPRVDAQGVASGRLSTGFLHGQLNTTFALQRPEQRTVAATRRWLDWPLGEGAADDEAIAFDERACHPLVPADAARRLRAAWSCADGKGADGYVRRCAAHVRAKKRRTGRERCASVIDLVNVGADYLGDFNVELALASWRAAASLRSAAPALTSDGEHPSDIAAENLGVALRKRRALLINYKKE